MAEIKPFPDMAEFLFNAPLYAVYETKEGLANLLGGSFRVDGHCPYCGTSSTFISGYESIVAARRSPGYDAIAALSAGLESPPPNRILNVDVSCARNPNGHKIGFVLLKLDKTIQKIGQYPSLADIANDESKAYRKVLSEEDSQELHKAIGLAAHGVGIGSYVYLRRIFERLIDNRFRDFKDIESWSEENYRNRRMPERIDLMKDHLPEFLVENRKVYSILSLGIHELAEEEALAFFPVLKASIVMILEEDEDRRKKLELKKQLKSAVEKYSPSTSKNAGGQ